MDREVLYRGKRSDNNENEWIYGYYVPADSSPCVLYGERRPIIITKEENTGMIVWYSVDDKTVGEYTGLSDNNGKKIFEGDVLRVHSYYHGTNFYGVVTRNEYGCYWIVKHNGEHIGMVYDIAKSIAPPEIIGNIHDNPNLAKECEENEQS